MNVLIIEDSKVEAQILSQTLKRIMDEPIRVQHTATLSDALNTLRAEQDKLDLVFLDLKLSDSPEWQDTYDSIAPYTKKVPVIVVSANNSPEVAHDILQRGAEDYIVKGGKKRSVDMLKETIDFALCRHKATKKLADVAERDEQCIHWLSGGYSLDQTET